MYSSMFFTPYLVPITMLCSPVIIVVSRTNVFLSFSGGADYPTFTGFPYCKEGLLNAGYIFSILGAPPPGRGGVDLARFTPLIFSRQVGWPPVGFASRLADLPTKVS